jgi:hypothetical protein
MSGRAGRPASEKQLEWIEKCRTGKQHELPADYFVAAQHDSAAAGAALDFLFSLPWKPRESSPTVSNPVTEPGLYVQGDEVFKVQRSRAGNLYALKLTVSLFGHSGSWEYQAGAIRGLSADQPLTLAEAQRLGALNGICVYCGTELTDDISKVRKVGPTCEKRLGGHRSQSKAAYEEARRILIEREEVSV